jgi:hypothetical protein
MWFISSIIINDAVFTALLEPTFRRKISKSILDLIPDIQNDTVHIIT